MPVSYTHLDVYKRQTTEFPKPPVVAVEAALVPANPELIAAAVPPPAINASAQVGNVPKSVNWLCLLYTSRCV